MFRLTPPALSRRWPAAAGLVHQLGITQRFFPQGFGRLDLIDFHGDVQQFQQWPPAHFEQQVRRLPPASCLPASRCLLA
jgi:hypothetical protein